MSIIPNCPHAEAPFSGSRLASCGRELCFVRVNFIILKTLEVHPQ